MRDRITLESLITEEEHVKYGIGKENRALDRSAIYDAVKDDIKASLSLKKPKEIQRPDFYHMVPETELEKSIQEVLNEKKVDIVAKRQENNFLFDFEKKMQRFNKIKSKRFRRMRRLDRKKRLDAENLLSKKDEGSNDVCVGDFCDLGKDNAGNFDRPSVIMSFEPEQKPKEEAKPIIYKEEVSDEFLKEKAEAVVKDMPQREEVVLPGWGYWGGKGCDIKKTKVNVTNKYIDGIRPEDRHDKDFSHIIISEKVPMVSEKHKVRKPRGYTKGEYEKKIKMMISKQWSSLRIFNKFVKPKLESEEKEVAEEFHFDPTYEG